MERLHNYTRNLLFCFGFEQKPVWLLVLAKHFMKKKKSIFLISNESDYWIIEWMYLDEPLVPPAHPANIDIILHCTDILYRKIHGNPNATPKYVCCWAFHVKNCAIQTRASVRLDSDLSGSHSCSNSFQMCSGRFRFGFCTGQSSSNQWLNYFLCALECSHVGTEKGPAQSIATKWEMHNSQERHCMLQH